MFSVSQAAKETGLSAKTLRYYAEIGLLRETDRSEAGYRLYDQASIARLTFVRRARDFGFSIPQCRDLLGLFDNPTRQSGQVKDLANRHLGALEKQRQELEQLCSSLKDLIKACPGDEGPDCPIISHLS